MMELSLQGTISKLGFCCIFLYVPDVFGEFCVVTISAVVERVFMVNKTFEFSFSSSQINFGFIIVEATHLHKIFLVLHFSFSEHLFLTLQLHGGTVLMFSDNRFLLCIVITDFMFLDARIVHFYTVPIKNLVEFVIFWEVLVYQI